MALYATEIHRKAQKEPQSQRGRERERRQGACTSPRRNQPAPALHIPRPKPPGDFTGRTRDVEFSESIDKCRGGHPDVSSLHRWRPAQHHGHDPQAELRGAQARCPHRPRSARAATPWWLCHLEQRGWNHLLDRSGSANDRGLMTKACRNDAPCVILQTFCAWPAFFSQFA